MKTKLRHWKHLLVCLTAILPLFCPISLPANPIVQVSFTPETIKQGDVLLITVKTGPEIHGISGTLFDKTIHFYRNPGQDAYTALAGIDLNTDPKRYNLSLSLEDKSSGIIKKDVEIQVVSAHFRTQQLTLPKEKVDLDEETLKRVNLEKEEIDKIWDISTAGPLWDGNFIKPVEGVIDDNFGFRRVINGEPRSPHTGIDIDAPEGTPVYAANQGRVVFTGDQFFSGKGLVIDHGLGLLTMYFHLSEILVTAGEDVRKGQVIARVGKTGRATGPHLHWGIRLNGARVNPASMLGLSLE
ncbi:MAG: M23 family metallopeptidase [Nitrospirae bacterium]|nr:M23 family metallopeptidase [Nitrospirota bacterium]